jgi:hypothetical protein
LRIFYLREFSDKTFWQEYACIYMKPTVRDILKNKKERIEK